MYQLDPETETPVPDDYSLYPYINNDIEYGLFEDIVDSYYLDSQIKDDFHCNQDCYTHQQESTIHDHSTSCTHAYDHIVQQIQDLSDSTQQHTLHSMEENASLFTNHSSTPCDFNITNQNSDTDNTNNTNISYAPKQLGIHSQSKHKYRNTFGESNIQYHDFDNQDALTFTDKYRYYYNKNYKIHIGVYMTQLQLQVTKFQKTWTLRLCHTQCISPAIQTVTKINHVPYQTIVYNENGMFTAKLLNDTPVEIFIDNGATPSILPLHTYNKFPILHTYPKTESNTPIHTGGGLIKSHFWLEIPLKLDHQTIQIKALVCSYDIILGWTSMAQLSAWQDYASHKLYIQQISVPLTVRNNVQVLPGKTGVVSLTLQPNKTSFTPRHTITRKGITYVKPFDTTLPLRPIEIEFENNLCCIEVHNTSNSMVEFLHGQEIAYFDARSKGLVQTNNSKHFPIDQYLHDRMTPATLSPTPLTYENPCIPQKCHI